MANQSPFNAANNMLVGTNYAYDARGNLTKAGAVTMTYDAENKLTQTVDGGTGQTTTFTYDASGKRVQKVVTGGATTVDVHDISGKLVAEYSTVAMTPACVTCYLTYDGLGSVRMITDQNGNVIGRHDLMPYGEELFSGFGGRTGNGFGNNDNIAQTFTGQERDGGTADLDYFNARSMSAVLGRFAQPDPQHAGADIMNPQTWNGYGYVGGNPLNGTDRSGMFALRNGQGGTPEDEYQDDSRSYPCWGGITCFEGGSFGNPIGGNRGGGGGGGNPPVQPRPPVQPPPVQPPPVEPPPVQPPPVQPPPVEPTQPVQPVPPVPPTTNPPSYTQILMTQTVVCGGTLGQPCVSAPLPKPTCNAVKNKANGLKLAGGAGAIYKGLSVAVVASGGTDLPEATVALAIAGMAGGSGTILGVAADWHIGCAP